MPSTPKSTPGHATPGHVTPGHATPGHATPGRATPDLTIPDPATPDPGSPEPPTGSVLGSPRPETPQVMDVSDEGEGEDEALPVPQVMIGPDGQIILNETR